MIEDLIKVLAVIAFIAFCMITVGLIDNFINKDRD